MATILLPPTQVQSEAFFQMPLPLSCDGVENRQHHWVDTFKAIMTKFVQDLKYEPEDPITDDNPTYQAVRSEFLTQYDNGNEWLDQMYRTAVTMGEVIRFLITLEPVWIRTDTKILPAASIP